MNLKGINTLGFYSDSNIIPWNSGVNLAFPKGEYTNKELVLAVECRLGNSGSLELALFDTAATWSIIGGQFTEELEGQYIIDDRSLKTIDTRHGQIRGILARLYITLPSMKNYGYDLEIESTVLISQDWDGPIVLGYRGFLERIRFAFSPQNDLKATLFYFGSDNT